MADNIHDHFERLNQKIGFLIYGFQILEQQMRLYINSFYLLNNLLLNKSGYKIDEPKKIKKYSMGQLLDVIKTFETDSILIDSLRNIKNKRNKVSHDLYLSLKGSDEDCIRYINDVNYNNTLLLTEIDELHNKMESKINNIGKKIDKIKEQIYGITKKI